MPVDKLLAAAADANAVLAKSDDAWDRLKPLVKPSTDEEMAAIKAYFRTGITGPWTAEATASAEKMTKLLIELGDTELVGDGTRFDPNLFYTASGLARRLRWIAGFERLGWVVASLLAFVALWQVVAMRGQRRAPLSDTRGSSRNRQPAGRQRGAVLQHLRRRCVRVALAFSSAMIIGSVIGILLGKFRRADQFFDPWLVLFLNMPAIVTITLCFIWGGMTEACRRAGRRAQQNSVRRRHAARRHACAVARSQ